MFWRPVLMVAVLGGVVGGTVAAAQSLPAKNPLEGNPDAIRAGMGLFRARCADCHGMDGTGVRGPDITLIWANGRSDDGLFKTIKEGVPNTEMPANPRIQDHEAWQLLAYVRTLAAPAPADSPRGNATAGEVVFRAQCASCHRVNGGGGRLGPDLSRVGVARSRDRLVLRIRRGIEDFAQGFEPVTLTPHVGQPIQGVKKNEDLFSVQIMDAAQRIQGYDKGKMKSVANGIRSAMPIFGTDRLSDAQLDDLLRYLQTLRGFDPVVTQ
jgi:cytochrome c oxidase cbb3-type subunit III